MSEVHGGDTALVSSTLRVSFRTLLQSRVELFPILCACQEQTVLARRGVQAPRPVTALVNLVSADAFQCRDLLLKLDVLLFQSRHFSFSSLELLQFLRLDYIVAAANQRK